MSDAEMDDRLRKAFNLGRFTDQQRSVTNELTARVQRHQDAIAQLATLPTARRPLNMLANGDSWFDYPLGSFPGVHTDVIAALEKLGSPAPIILNLAHYGDTTVQELGLVRQQRIAAAISDPRNGRFDGILLSGGGNDIAGDALAIWLVDADQVGHDPDRAVDQSRFAAGLQMIRASYLDLVSIRDRLLSGAPIFAHSYDFPRPTGQGVCTLGPWLKPALEYCGWTDQETGAGIIAGMLKQFAAVLDQLVTEVPNFIHVRTHGTVQPLGWANELHPNPAGFVAIAGKFHSALSERFPDRI
jgi:hypothetical protein